MNLELCLFKENQAYFKNKYSDNYKIVTNSPGVHFNIKREYAKVGHNNIISFGYKNHLVRIFRNGKQFIKNDLHHNFVQFLVQKLAMT
jgi:Fe-S oxidoreductase